MSACNRLRRECRLSGSTARKVAMIVAKWRREAKEVRK